MSPSAPSRALAAALLLAACRPPPSPAPVVALPPAPPPPSAAPTASAAPEAPAEPPTPCDPFLERAREAAARKIPVNDAYTPDAVLWGLCAHTERGVWALEYRDVAVSGADARWDGAEINANVVVVHLDAQGKRSEAPAGTLRVAAFQFAGVRVGTPFDADGDGDDEVTLHGTRAAPFSYGSSGILLTARGGKIAPYPKAQGIDVAGVEDVDGDGRLDLLTPGPFPPDDEIVCGDWKGSNDPPLLLAAHARGDGAFSFDDAAAIAYAKKECPRAPSSVIVDAFSFDNLRNVRCARLWGASPAAVGAAVRKTCRAEAKGCPPKSGECLHFATLTAWATAKPPLRLAK